MYGEESVWDTSLEDEVEVVAVEVKEVVVVEEVVVIEVEVVAVEVEVVANKLNTGVRTCDWFILTVTGFWFPMLFPSSTQ